jgi:hypothetical protein
MPQRQLQISFSEGRTIARQFFSLIDLSALAKRVTALQRDYERNYLLKELIADKYNLEFALLDLSKAPTADNLSKLSPSIDELRALEFSIQFCMLYNGAHPKQQRALSKRFFGCLNDAHGIAPFELELVTALNLTNFGFAIRPAESTGNRFDLLADVDNFQFEVECKHISADSGRKIHRRPFSELANSLICKAREAFPSVDGLLQTSIAARSSLPTDLLLVRRFAEEWLSAY